MDEKVIFVRFASKRSVKTSQKAIKIKNF